MHKLSGHINLFKIKIEVKNKERSSSNTFRRKIPKEEKRELQQTKDKCLSISHPAKN